METRRKVGNDCGKREGKKEGRQDRDGRIDSSGCFSNLLYFRFFSPSFDNGASNISPSLLYRAQVNIWSAGTQDEYVRNIGESRQPLWAIGRAIKMTGLNPFVRSLHFFETLFRGKVVVCANVYQFRLL